MPRDSLRATFTPVLAHGLATVIVAGLLAGIGAGLLAGIVTGPAAASGKGAVTVAPNSPPEQLSEDRIITTASGAKFLAAKGWFVSSQDGRLLLEDPERELKLTLLELTAPDGAAAITQAWSLAQPDFQRAVRHSLNPPAREGWDEVIQTMYEVGTDEPRTVLALARRKGETWYVGLVDGADAAVDRRGAQLQTALVSFEAPGVGEESFAGKRAHPLDQERLSRYAAFIEEARVASGVPGVAIAIVQDGKTVFERGFGRKDAGRDDPVDPETLFLIGSTTKSLTTFMMASLVDQGKMRWDQPVTELYPGFSLADADVTRRVTMEHTVCACTGLPRQDMEFLFESGASTPEQTVASMATMTPTTGFGETFQYSNPMVSTGGYVAAHTASPGKPLGQAYDEAMESLVFQPLKMKDTTLDFARARRGNHASPHGTDLALEVDPLPLEIEYALIPFRPAGGAWSSARDMSRYLLMELSGGKDEDGKQIISPENLLHRRDPQVKITDDLSYGLGLFVQRDNDVLLVHHGGNTLGFTADMFFFPDHGVGAVVLTNLGGSANAFRSVARRRLIEILFDGREEAQENLTYELTEREAILEKERAEMDFAPDRAWLESMAGAYFHPSLGRVEVHLEGDGAIFDAGEWKSAVGRRRASDGAVKLMLTTAPWAGFEFLPGEKDGKKTLGLELSQQQYLFEQVR